MDPKHVLASRGGVARWTELKDAGVTRYALQRSTAAGDIGKIGRGTYVLGDTSWPVATAALQSAALCCVSAAVVHHLWVWKQPGIPHILSGRALPPGNYVAHRTGTPVRGLSPVVDCIRQVLQCLPELEALVIAESAVVKGLTTAAALDAAVQGRHSVRARRILRRIDAGSQSLVETIARETFRSAGLMVESQQRFDDVGRVDLWVQGKVVVELDGRDFHTGERDFVEDRRRWNQLTLQLVPVLRFPAKMVLRRPDRVLEQVQLLLDRLA